MCSGVRVHEYDVTGISAAGIDAAALAVQVVYDRAAWRMCHPDLIRGIACGLKARHPEKVIDAQIVNARPVDLRHDGCARLGIDAVQSAMLIVGSPWTAANRRQRFTGFGTHRPDLASSRSKSQTARAENMGSSFSTACT